MEFLNWFEGKYNNWNQASSDPIAFPQVILEHNWIRFKEKPRGHCPPENFFNITKTFPGNKPYSDVNVKIYQRPDKSIVVENDTYDYKYVFQKKGDIYQGTISPAYIRNNVIIASRAELSETQYKVIDVGICERTKKILWGSQNGHFIFDKI